MKIQSNNGTQNHDRPKAGKERKMNDKIKSAIEYSAAHGNTEEAKNDAANIFAINYDEYMTIWSAIKNM